MARSFFELRTWKESHELVMEIYSITFVFPNHERFGLIGQLRRAALSVPSNIAEGTGRGSKKDLVRFLVMARGSVQEVIYQLYLASKLNYLEEEKYVQLQKRYQGLSLGLTKHIESLS